MLPLLLLLLSAQVLHYCGRSTVVCTPCRIRLAQRIATPKAKARLLYKTTGMDYNRVDSCVGRLPCLSLPGYTAVGLPSGGRLSRREGGVGPARWCRLGPQGGGDAGSDGLVEWPLPAIQVNSSSAPFYLIFPNSCPRPYPA